jgi:ubiquitin C-terminal hydrolase
MVKNNNIDPNISSDIINSIQKLRINFGFGQESVSEAFIIIINNINEKKLSTLFTHRYKCVIVCKRCNYTSITIDNSMILNLFYMKEVNEKNILNHYSELIDYKCEKCGNTNCCNRIYSLSMLPEIIIGIFNIYYKKEKHNFPNLLTFPGKFEKEMKYKLIGQIEHSGSLNGGHYWARALRKDNKVYLLNDSGVSLSKFEPTENTYMIIYHKI